MASPIGFEPTAPGLGILCSILLSYGDTAAIIHISTGLAKPVVAQRWNVHPSNICECPVLGDCCWSGSASFMRFADAVHRRAGTRTARSAIMFSGAYRLFELALTDHDTSRRPALFSQPPTG